MKSIITVNNVNNMYISFVFFSLSKVCNFIGININIIKHLRTPTNKFKIKKKNKLYNLMCVNIVIT